MLRLAGFLAAAFYGLAIASSQAKAEVNASPELYVDSLQLREIERLLPLHKEIARTCSQNPQTSSAVLKVDCVNNRTTFASRIPFLEKVEIQTFDSIRYGVHWYFSGGLLESEAFVENDNVYSVRNYNKRVKSLKEIYPTGYLSASLESLERENRKSKFLLTIVDGGVDYNHLSLAYKIPRENPGYDYEYADRFVFDETDHGTGVSDLASRDLDVHLINQKATRTGFEQRHLQLQAIQTAYDQGSRLFNLSIGTKYADGMAEVLRGFLEAFRKFNDVLFVVGAGNNGANLDEHEYWLTGLNLANVIIVANAQVDPETKEISLHSTSNYSVTNVDLAAIGTHVRAASRGDRYREYTGTSFSTPQVTNVAAQIMLKYPKLSVAKVKEAIVTSVQIMDSLKGKVRSNGILDAQTAIQKARTL